MNQKNPSKKLIKKIHQKIAKWGCSQPHFAIWRLCGGENGQIKPI
jgi:hypothetical protein